MGGVPHVLYVDDDTAVSRAFVRSLHGMEIRITVAGGVTAAIAMMQSEKFDVVATDMTMPDGTGVDVLTEAVTLQPRAAFMVISGNPNVEAMLAGLPVDFVIAKPWDVAALRADVLAAIAIGAQRGSPP